MKNLGKYNSVAQLFYRLRRTIEAEQVVGLSESSISPTPSMENSSFNVQP